MIHESADELEIPYVLLGTLDDKVSEYPFAVGPSHLVSMEKVAVVNALLSPPIVIEEGHLLASSDVMAVRTDGSIIVALLEAGLLKIMSRDGDLDAYWRARRRNAHLAPPAGPESSRMIESLQRACEDRQAFLPYPPSSIDRFTFERFLGLRHSSSLAALSDLFKIEELDAFEDRFHQAYLYGNRGGQWTSRSAWEHAAKLSFSGRPAVLRVLMSIANRERHILRAAGLARALGKDVIVETGFDVGESTFSTAATPMVDEVRLRSRARQDFFKQISFEDVVQVYPALFEELSDPTSTLARKKAAWLAASGRSEDVSGQDDFLEMTHEYLSELSRFTMMAPDRAPNRIFRDANEAVFSAAYGMLVPASLNFLLAESSQKLSRRQVMRALLAGGAAAGLYQLRPWGGTDGASSRSRLVTARSRAAPIDETSVPGVFQDNFHERLVVSHAKATAGMAL